MVHKLLGSACEVCCRSARPAERSSVWPTMPAELGRRLSAGVGIVHGSSEPRADRDRDLVESIRCWRNASPSPCRDRNTPRWCCGHWARAANPNRTVRRLPADQRDGLLVRAGAALGAAGLPTEPSAVCLGSRHAQRCRLHRSSPLRRRHPSHHPCSAGAWHPAPGPGGLSGQPVEPSQTQAFIRPPQRRPAAAIPVAATLLGPQRTGRSRKTVRLPVID